MEVPLTVFITKAKLMSKNYQNYIINEILHMKLTNSSAIYNKLDFLKN
jgi:hypothetical protein